MKMGIMTLLALCVCALSTDLRKEMAYDRWIEKYSNSIILFSLLADAVITLILIRLNS